MYKFEDIKIDLQKNLKPSRYEHILRVIDKAVNLAEVYDIDKEKIKTAALLHDCAKGNEAYYKKVYNDDYNLFISKKEYKEFKNPFLEHCLLGAIVSINKYKITDKEIINSIIYHTTGRVGMSDFEKIIYLADKTESGRNYPNVEKIRKMSLIDLNNAIILSVNNTIGYLIDENQEISLKTIKLRNNLIGGYIGEQD